MYFCGYKCNKHLMHHEVFVKNTFFVYSVHVKSELLCVYACMYLHGVQRVQNADHNFMAPGIPCSMWAVYHMEAFHSWLTYHLVLPAFHTQCLSFERLLVTLLFQLTPTGLF